MAGFRRLEERPLLFQGKQSIMQVPENHRILQEGEIIRAGDLFLNDEGAWEPVPHGNVKVTRKSDGFETEQLRWSGPEWKATNTTSGEPYFVRKMGDEKEIIVRSRTLARD